jgi:hypothetical protein
MENGEQHVGAPAIADAGFGGCQPHTGNGRQVGNVFGSEGGDGRGHLEARHHWAGAQRRDPVIPIGMAVMCLPKRDGTRNSGLPDLRKY